MKARIKGHESPDVQDLSSLDGAYALEDFGILVQVMVGPENGPGEESFNVMVCSPKWLANEVKKGPLVGRHFLFMESWDFPRLESELRKLFEIEGQDWHSIGTRLSRIGKWEFEDYNERP